MDQHLLIQNNVLHDTAVNGRLERLMDEINGYVENQAEDDVLQDIENGKYCLAEYTSYDQR